jgi:hypothetical protein
LKILFKLLCVVGVAFCPALLRAQAPYVTDDIEVADYHKWHLEVTNEYDILKSSDYPNLRQNTANFKISFGAFKNVELGFDNQLLNISTAPNPIYPDAVFGYGDLDLSVKWKIREEKEGSKWPGFGASLNIEIPTGDERKQLGSGVADYYLNGVMQKSLPKKNTWRLNGGLYFAGNPATGVVGDRTTRGFVFTGATSLVHDYTDKFSLGIEVAGAGSWNQLLGKGQLQTEVGGNYNVTKKLSVVFGFIAGFYRDSPRYAPTVGIEKDF